MVKGKRALLLDWLKGEGIWRSDVLVAAPTEQHPAARFGHPLADRRISASWFPGSPIHRG